MSITDEHVGIVLSHQDRPDRSRGHSDGERSRRGVALAELATSMLAPLAAD